MGKKQRRARSGRHERRFTDAREALADVVAELATKRGIPLAEAREELLYLMQIRAEYSARFDGSGMVVKDVFFNPETEQIEVVVGPVDPGGAPAGWGPVARERLAVLRGELEGEQRESGRVRIAEIELEEAFGKKHAARARLMALVAPEVVRAAAAGLPTSTLGAAGGAGITIVEEGAS